MFAAAAKEEGEPIGRRLASSEITVHPTGPKIVSTVRCLV
jgi:hypothetical protein